MVLLNAKKTSTLFASYIFIAVIYMIFVGICLVSSPARVIVSLAFNGSNGTVVPLGTNGRTAEFGRLVLVDIIVVLLETRKV
jgi:predicted ester cyclase